MPLALVSSTALRGACAGAILCVLCDCGGTTLGDSPADAATSTDDAAGLLAPLDAAGTGDGGFVLGLDLSEAATAPVCASSVGSVVCFGADAATYSAYVVRPDAGLSVGQCPSAADLSSPAGDGQCGTTVCGPIADDGGSLPDAAASDSSCCWYIERVCGV